MTRDAGPRSLFGLRRGPRRRGLARRYGFSWGVGLSLAVIVVVVVCAVFGTVVAPYDAAAQDLLNGMAAPSWSHLLGTDPSGRDILSRVIVGTHDAVLGPALITLGSITLSLILGLNAGYRGGWIDSLIMRILDVAYSLPGALIAIVVLGVVGGGYWTAVMVLILLGVPVDTRIIRAAALEQRERPYVDAARVLNVGSWRIMFRHVLPNIRAIVVANLFLGFAGYLVAMSALGFLGLGLQPGSADWGSMLSSNLANLETNPLAALAPGLALILVATTTNLVGDWLFELITDRGEVR